MAEGGEKAALAVSIVLGPRAYDREQAARVSFRPHAIVLVPPGTQEVDRLVPFFFWPISAGILAGGGR